VLIETACARVRRPETLSRVLGLGRKGLLREAGLDAACWVILLIRPAVKYSVRARAVS